MSTKFMYIWLKNNQTIKRYRESFKLKLLDELSSGKYTKRELSRIHELVIYDFMSRYYKSEIAKGKYQKQQSGKEKIDA